VSDGQLWSALRRGWLVTLVFLILGLAAAVAFLRLAPSTYTARAELYVLTSGGLTVSELSSGSTVAQAQASNLAIIATSNRVLQPVVSQLRLGRSAQDVGDAVSATVPSKTSVIQLEVEDRSPQDAATIANAVASSLVNTTEDLLPPARRGAPALQVQIVQSAVVPAEPSAPSAPLSILLGLALGLLAGLALALAIEGRRRNGTEASRQVAAAERQRPDADGAYPGKATPNAGSGQQPAEAWGWGSN